MFNFGSTTVTRSWNIKIALLPCGANYLGIYVLKNSNNNFGNLNLPRATAPLDCLQYFTATQGQVSSFNWKDAALAPRQLVGQDYNICFRAELINSQV